MENIIIILIFQGFLGGFDVLWNHEYKEQLYSKATAELEQKIHGVRELLYGAVFLGLSWFSWQGFWAYVIWGVIFVEIILTAWDFVIEDRTRLLSPTERITHLVLSMTGGAYVALLLTVLLEWSLMPSEITYTEYGIFSWILSVLGFGVVIWGIRDLLSGLSLAKISLKTLSDRSAENNSIVDGSIEEVKE